MEMFELFMDPGIRGLSTGCALYVFLSAFYVRTATVPTDVMSHVKFLVPTVWVAATMVLFSIAMFINAIVIPF